VLRIAPMIVGAVFLLAAVAASAGRAPAAARLEAKRYLRVCLRDRDGRSCQPRRARAHALLYQPVLYRNTGPQLTTWRVRGKVVGRWRWRVVPEPE
jgi:hypothetical protein